MTDPAKPPTHRLNHLDALRGLAAMCVVCFHYTEVYNVPYTPRWIMATPLHFWFAGDAAVSLFFVLSGLVLSIKYFRDTDAPRLTGFGYGGYLVGRVCRIWIPFAIVLLLSAALWQFSAQHIRGGPNTGTWFSVEHWQAPPTATGVLKQANLANINNDFNLIPQAWTLAIEIVLSALVPAGIVLAGRSTIWLLLATAIACLLGGISPFALHFAVGIALAKHFRGIVGWLRTRAGLRVALAAVAWVLCTWKYLAEGVHPLHAGFVDWYVSGLGAAILLVVVSASPSLCSWLGRGVFHHIGRTSYSLYLSHLLVIFCISPRIVVGVIKLHPSIHWLYAWAIGLAGTCVIAAILAEAVYWSAEVPAIACGRWLAGHVGRRGVRTGPLTATVDRSAVPVG